MNAELDRFCQNLGYKFKNIETLELSLMHPSVNSNDRSSKNYERMEFLGDTVLNMVVTELLIEKFPLEAEGNLSKRRAALVCTDSLKKIALNIGLDKVIILSPSEEASGGRVKAGNLEDCLEALIGAIYTDGGLEEVKRVIEKHFGEYFDKMDSPPIDPKGYLQEWLHKMNYSQPEYNIISQTGPAHDPEFEIRLTVKEFPEILVKAKSKKAGQKLAAETFIEKYIS